MKFTVRNQFDTNVDTYWNEIFFSEEYNSRLYREGLGFKGFELVELTGEKGQRRTRKLRTEPAADAPAVVRKLIGDSLSYTETGSWDPATKVWSYSISTSKLSDKIRIGGRLWAEPRGDKLERIAEIEIEVKILGVGGTIEKFLEKTTRESYVKATDFTNRFIAEKGL
ncbi:MAG: DUF2505 domain-containing protein [Sandaracinaceae bacterium]|nr:DUF2505 domain-containing protein [Sandaracinaceae bacterium]